MNDEYNNFAELKNKERKKDYSIEISKRDSKYVIISPHGGGIEQGTTEISKEIAGQNHSYYSFIGKKRAKNFDYLHITSNNFDEPKGIELVESAEKCISIHGDDGEEKVVYVGGKDTALREQIIKSLNENGFEAKVDNRPGKKGASENNICNRCKSKQGVQLEITKGLRRDFFKGLDGKDRKVKTDNYWLFINVFKSILDG